MTKEVKEKIGHFLGLLINLCIAFFSLVLISEPIDSFLLDTFGDYLSDEQWYLCLLIFFYPAWRWRAKPMQFLIWCYQKL